VNCPANVFCESKLIVFDMDQTLIDAETIDELARAAGVAGEVEKITRKAMSGDLDFGEALRERVKLLEGLPLKAAQAAISEISFMPGAKELISYVKGMGYTTAMISGGFTLSAERVGKALGIDYVVSNELFVKDGRLTGQVGGPLTFADSKACVFEELARLNGVLPEECIALGDGANDVCIFEKAGFAIAFNPKPVLKQYADVIISKKDLRAVIPVLESLGHLSRNKAQHVDIEEE